MPLETEVIPYEPSLLRGERLLVLAPHPDDEVIACGGLVAQHIRELRPVRIVIATDGAAADETADRESYRTRREDESREGVRLLGGAEIEFLRLPDRELAAHTTEAAERIAAVLRDFKPTLILAPSPIEIHPDHATLAATLCELLQRDEDLASRLAVARVAFYELTQPIRPNAIVDISGVAETKFAAIAAHVTQSSLRDYSAYARGLGAYRAMTMPPGTTYAEAYFVVGVKELRTTPVSSLQSAMGNARSVLSVERETQPISVIVRTKDRPALLREAVDSIRATGYPAEIVVVNDGGALPDWLKGDQPAALKLVNHETSRGRSEAANAGVRAAGSALVAFLDDDDLLYPEHLATLAAAFDSAKKPVYSDAVSSALRVGESGLLESQWRLRLFAQDFDPELLLVDNYIPLPTILLSRSSFLDLGGFSPEFDLFEDWDFLIRLAAKTPFVHVPKVTCEIRHVETAGSILLASPEGSASFREAKLRIWRKHAEKLTPGVFADVFERQKRAANALKSDDFEQRGLVHHMQENVARLEREKAQLQYAVNEQTIRAEAVSAALRETQGTLAGSQLALVEARTKVDSQSGQIAELTRQNADACAAVEETQTTTRALYAEIHRLQAVLDTIYKSKTWKLHEMVEKVRGH